ncbi:MAG: hypothetical protein IKP53_08320 [Candidatus Methanomethylophilaceae archaeon]|nr:hypothetical protein [Candidatus Methanomethylophilaceae archaeon]
MAKTTGKRMNAAIRAAELGESDGVRTGRQAFYVGKDRIHITALNSDYPPFGVDMDPLGISVKRSKGAFDDGEEFDASTDGMTLVLRKGRDTYHLPLVEVPDPPKAPKMDFGTGADIDLDAEALRKELKKAGKDAYATIVAGFDRDLNRVAFAVVRDGNNKIIGGARIGRWTPNDGDERRPRRARFDATMLRRTLGRSKKQGMALEDSYPMSTTDYEDEYQLFLAPRITGDDDIERELRDEEDAYIKTLNLASRAVWMLADGSVGKTVPSGNGFSRMDRYDPRGGLHIGRTAAAGTPVARYCASAGWAEPLRKVDPGVWDAFAAKDRGALRKYAKSIPELKGAKI